MVVSFLVYPLKSIVQCCKGGYRVCSNNQVWGRGIELVGVGAKSTAADIYSSAEVCPNSICFHLRWYVATATDLPEVLLFKYLLILLQFVSDCHPIHLNM